MHSFRSGSNLIARILSQNGIGDAREWLNSEYVGSVSAESRSEKKKKLLELVEERSVNDIFSIKLPLDHFCNFTHHLGIDGTKIGGLHQKFGKVEFIRIDRADIIAQSISFWRAKVTNQWYLERGFHAEDYPDYNFIEINECYNYICREKFIWNEIIKNSNVKIHKLEYEKFIEDKSYIKDVIYKLWDGEMKKFPINLEYQLLRQSDSRIENYKKHFIKDYIKSKIC